MEKLARSISTIITFILVYTMGIYTYLTAKGFEYDNGTFTLVASANAAQETLPLTNGIAAALDDNLSLNVKAPVVLGDENAPLTLYEYSSLGCTHCADFHLNILPRIQKEFIDTGKIKVVFVNFPLEKKSMQGAMLFDCVPQAYKHNFLNMVFSKQRDWMLSYRSDKILTSYALASGLNKNDAEECLKNDDLAKEIMANRQEAIDQLKMQGTPAFVVSGHGKKEIIYGVPSPEDLTAYLNGRLAE